MELEEVTILIVDDNASNIVALQGLLERPERTILTASSGKDGLKLALENNIDLILLDVQMPEMNGFEVAQILKSHKRTKDIPIIFASGEMKERNSIMKGFEEGAVDYLSKPLDPELTKAKVSVLLKIQLQKKELILKNNSLKKAEEQISNLNAYLHRNLLQVESMNKELESFSYSVSHDLRAPLRAIIGYSKVLEECCGNVLDEEGKRLLKVIQQNSLRMNSLIDDLLEFSKLGRKELNKVSIESNAIVNEIVRDAMEHNSQKAQFHVNELPSTFADLSLLKQVWINLVSNAIKYSSKKENPLIEIGSEDKNDEVVYYIKDNGAGFDMEYAGKLFNVFQRLHKASEFEGTGVGLALVHKIISKHNGRVWAEGKKNEGAKFYFSLPKNPAY